MAAVSSVYENRTVDSYCLLVHVHTKKSLEKRHHRQISRKIIFLRQVLTFLL